MDFRQVDLKMLYALRILIAEGHVTKAAERLGISQPRLSSTLARLRKITGDPLLVRTTNGMKPTNYALKLSYHTGEYLDKIQEVTGTKLGFNPATAERRFNILATDLIIKIYLSRFMRKLRQEAPHITMSASMPATQEIIDRLQDGEADLAVFLDHHVPDYYYSMKFVELDRLFIAATDHPYIRGKVSVEEFTRSSHVVATFGPSYHLLNSEEMIEEALSAMGKARHISMYVQGILPIPEIVANTDLVAVIPRALALQAQTHYGLQALPLPFTCQNPRTSLIWHERNHNDAAHRWLRSALKTWSFEERE